MLLGEVRTCPSGMEYSLHAVPRTHKREVQAIFPDLENVEALTVVPTCQRADINLLDTGGDVDREKDDLLETFCAWARQVCDRLAEQGHWCDYIDPCSGLPMVHRQYQQPYSEVDGLATLLQYSVQNAGCCKVVLHPKWGGSVYPATLFARAPPEDVQAAIAAVNAAGGDKRVASC